MGFCFVNNVAVAAAHAMEVYGLKRIAILDWDVHHGERSCKWWCKFKLSSLELIGNGTQHMFEDSNRVLFISLHQDGLYPHNSGWDHS